ncbi:MAG TPA: adenylate/guanylate cyclase domain-containing protein, partial [Rhizomicrobium sp.]
MQRKLTAILSADVVGYSGLMEADEAGTLTRLKDNRGRIFDPVVAEHGGRVFKLLGDGALVEFASVVAAVNCALAIQAATAGAEPHLAEDKRLRYRIGINLGDVIVDGDDIYGEGVNIAARLQTLAPVGGIALSRNVSDQVAGKVAAVFDDLGLHTVKNIERPVHVFALRPAGAAAPPGSPARPQRVSICVLPFANMSGDAEQEYFSDGISEDIITDLSKVSALSVVSRNTAFTFKGRNVDLGRVARQLNVSHILEGSVRKAANRVRITAQLIDGRTDDHVWAERWDRDLNDIFALQDEISEAIVTALKLKLLPDEKKAIERRGTDNPQAYEHLLMARQYSVARNMTDARGADMVIRLCRRAIEIDPSYAQAWALLARTQQLLGYAGQGGDYGQAAAEKALALDDALADAHAVRATNLMLAHEDDEAQAEFDLALRLDPKSYEVNKQAARFYFRRKRFADAIRHYEKAVEVMATDYASLGLLISCYQMIGDRAGSRRAAERTRGAAEEAIAQQSENGSAISMLIGALAHLGEAERARQWIARALVLDPD